MELILNWFSENQTLLIGYSIKLIAAIVIFVVGQFIAKIITQIPFHMFETQKFKKDQSYIKISLFWANTCL